MTTTETAVRRPGPVTAAVVLLGIGAVLAAIVALVAFGASGNAKDLARDLGMTGASDPDALRTVLVMVGVLLLVIAVVDAVFAWRLSRGGRTARLVYTVIAVLTILSNLGSAVASHQASHVAIALIPLVVVGLLWLPQSSQDFFDRT